MPGIGANNTPVAVAAASTNDVRRLLLVDVDVVGELDIEFALTSDCCSMPCCCRAAGHAQQICGRAKERAECNGWLVRLPWRDSGSPVRGRLFT